MAAYLYQHPVTEEVIEVFQSIHEDHTFYIKDGEKYLRLFTSPQLAQNTRIDPNNAQDFINKTGTKRGTIGDMMTASAELGKQRADREGLDPVKEDYYKNYAKTRKGSEHKDVKLRRTREKAAKVGITIED